LATFRATPTTHHCDFCSFNGASQHPPPHHTSTPNPTTSTAPIAAIYTSTALIAVNVGCPALASTGRIVINDEAKATAITDEYRTLFHSKKNPTSAEEEDTQSAAARRARVPSAATASASTQGGHLKTPPEQLLQGGSAEPTAQTTNTTTKTKTIHYHDEYEEIDSDYDDEGEAGDFHLHTAAF